MFVRFGDHHIPVVLFFIVAMIWMAFQTSLIGNETEWLDQVNFELLVQLSICGRE